MSEHITEDPEVFGRACGDLAAKRFLGVARTGDYADTERCLEIVTASIGIFRQTLKEAGATQDQISDWNRGFIEALRPTVEGWLFGAKLRELISEL